MELSAAAAHEHLRPWEAEAAAHDIPAPPGVIARERSRPDRVHAGALRRQRLAVAVTAARRPPSTGRCPSRRWPDDERAWGRALAARGRRPAGDGWTA